MHPLRLQMQRDMKLRGLAVQFHVALHLKT